MKKFLLSFVLLTLAVWAGAQVSVTARVDKTNLTLDDELTLTVEVNGASGNMVMPQLPSLPAFNVYSREVQRTSINGKTSTVFRYTMLPRFVGNATIGAIQFTYNGKTYKTDPISVSIYRNAQGISQSRPASSSAKAVSSGNYDSAAVKRPRETADPNLPPLERDLANQAYARGDENYFLVAAVSDKNPYVNEAVTLAVRFYYNRPFYDAPYQKPTVSNIFMEDAGSSQGTQSIGGNLYRYEEQRYLLTGATPGQATIGPATVRYMTGSSPLSVVDRLFGGAIVSQEQTAQSAPFTLTVRALPANGKPGSFYGAVGTGFTMSAQADRTRVEAGEAVTLTVTVKGPGNLKPTADLQFPALDGFKMYPAQAVSDSSVANGRISSTKVFKTVLVPAASGIYTIPAVKWSYFDPSSRTYKTLQTEPISLTVSPSTKTDTGFDFGAAAAAAAGIQTLGQDIAYLKTDHAPAPSVLVTMSTWRMLNWILLAVLAASVLFASVGRKSLASKRVYTSAKSRLKKAFSPEAVSEAVSDYLQQRMHISTGSLPLKAILAALAKHGITPATVEAFSLLWQRLDVARFAPGTPGTLSAQELAHQALDILKLLEEEAQ